MGRKQLFIFFVITFSVCSVLYEYQEFWGSQFWVKFAGKLELYNLPTIGSIKSFIKNLKKILFDIQLLLLCRTTKVIRQKPCSRLIGYLKNCKPTASFLVGLTFQVLLFQSNLRILY